MSMSFRWLVFGLAALLFNFPLISTLLTSLKSEGEIVSNPSIVIQSPTFANYVKIFEMADRFDILHFLWNSLVISALGAFFALLLAFPAAYVIVRTGFGRNWLLPFVLNLRAPTTDHFCHSTVHDVSGRWAAGYPVWTGAHHVHHQFATDVGPAVFNATEHSRRIGRCSSG